MASKATTITLVTVGTLTGLCCMGGAVIGLNSAARPRTAPSHSAPATVATTPPPAAEPVDVKSWLVTGRPTCDSYRVVCTFTIRNNQAHPATPGLLSVAAYNKTGDVIASFAGAGNAQIGPGRTAKIGMFADDAGQKLDISTVGSWVVS